MSTPEHMDRADVAADRADVAADRADVAADRADVAVDRENVAEDRDAFAERMLRSLSGLFDMTTIVIGDRLGLYRTLATEGALSPPELAARTGTNERYVREWLEHFRLYRLDP